MRKSIIYSLLVMVLIIFMSSFLNAKKIDENAVNEFKTFTSAVCEEKDDFVHCRDVLFVNCNGKVSKASEIENCNGFDVFGDVTGFAIFDKDWKDPRE